MQLETTIYISEENYLKLEEKKAETGISKNRLIKCLLRNEVSREKRVPVLLNTVSYQEKLCADDKFRRLHVALDDELYERCLDMRRVFKLSVSYIIALCISQYLDDINSAEFNTDNYRNVYIFFSEKNEFFKGYVVYWDIPTHETLTHTEFLYQLCKT